MKMKIWLTEIHAICPKEKQLKVWVGPEAIGKDKADAQRYLNQNGLGYCKIIGEKKGSVLSVKMLEKLN